MSPIHAVETTPVRRGGGGGGGAVSFLSLTSWARPAFTPVRTVNFTTKAGLDSAISGMQAGDLIQYTGTGVLNINSTTTNAYAIQNKNPASTVVFDFGTAKSDWAPGNVSSNYVSFAYTGSPAGFAGFWVNNCTNLRFYGGSIATNGQSGLLIQAPSHDILWYDAYLHDCAGGGVVVRGTTSGGVASATYNLTVRAEVNRWAMYPGNDNHPDKGTGWHACELHSSTGDIHDLTMAIYGHDSLRPGETSFGTVWPEGGGGGVIEVGNSSGSNYSNGTFYCKAVNCLMQPNGTNPGSTSQQTGGNAMMFWGSVPLDNNVVGWVEGTNLTGAPVHGTPTGGWYPGSPPITVNHGRHTNTNQFVGSGGNTSEPYITGHGIVYNDCT